MNTQIPPTDKPLALESSRKHPIARGPAPGQKPQGTSVADAMATWSERVHKIATVTLCEHSSAQIGSATVARGHFIDPLGELGELLDTGVAKTVPPETISTPGGWAVAILTPLGWAVARVLDPDPDCKWSCGCGVPFAKGCRRCAEFLGGQDENPRGSET